MGMLAVVRDVTTTLALSSDFFFTPGFLTLSAVDIGVPVHSV